MGEHSVAQDANEKERREFMRALLVDVQALERMLDGGAFEKDVRRIGAEQEMFLVDHSMRPANVAVEVLEEANDPRVTTELAQFNLEANLTPLTFDGKCLSAMEAELREVLGIVSEAAAKSNAAIMLTGILPTLQQADLGLDSMTPKPRYYELNDAMVRMRGGDFRVQIKGMDDLQTTHDNVMLESCNTSFQIHFQVGAEEFAPLYNLAQVVAAPVLAAAVNSPVLLGHRLWCETRVALFRHSLDTRSDTAPSIRNWRPRVSFGDAWVNESVLEIFREDIARFRALLAIEIDEDPMKILDEGGVPTLGALRLHNGTVYRWNRPCYGISGDKPHLRIENRILPAGPTVEDEIANSAFFFGLMSSMADYCTNLESTMDFDDAKANFFAAARHGLAAQFTWKDGRNHSAGDLILNELAPAAREGLRSHNIDEADVDRYIGIVEDRVRSGQTGSRWALKSLSGMRGRAPKDTRFRTLTSTMLERQRSGRPVHEWPLAVLEETRDWRYSYRTVGQFMSTDLFTVQPDDLVDLAASMMDWERIRHVPVEDSDGQLVGVVSHRAVLRLVARGLATDEAKPVLVRDIMAADPVTVTPETPTLAAIRLMREKSVGCLPVQDHGKLVGIVTEHDLIDVAAQLLEESLREDD
ncbi:MAG: CBS domain-containing protein [Planctomycetota bacterium]|jgi:CBS domain-containing protein/gamma-glutamyl:cysteine ligase YbdK (ATP-grasp superfamily)